MQILKATARSTKILEKLVLPFEKISKGTIFDCRMCGQCVLHSTGMVCPMRCPKNLRNGPCGGVRANGNCEVYPDKPCVWTLGIRRASNVPLWRDHELRHLQPPVNWRLQGTSSWVSLLTGADAIRPAGWKKSNREDAKNGKR